MLKVNFNISDEMQNMQQWWAPGGRWDKGSKFDYKLLCETQNTQYNMYKIIPRF